MASASYLRKAGLGLAMGLLVGVLAAGGIASAQEADDAAAAIADLISSVDTFWLLITGFLVFFMQAGFGLLEAGFVRVKNTTNILMKNVPMKKELFYKLHNVNNSSNTASIYFHPIVHFTDCNSK